MLFKVACTIGLLCGLLKANSYLVCETSLLLPWSGVSAWSAEICSVRRTLLIGERWQLAFVLQISCGKGLLEVHSRHIHHLFPPLTSLFYFFPATALPLQSEFPSSRPITASSVQERSNLIGCQGFSARSEWGWVLIFVLLEPFEKSNVSREEEKEVEKKVNCREWNVGNSKYLAKGWM